MRLIITLLLTALLVLGVWTFWSYEAFLMGPSPDGYTWWWPAEVSTYGEDIDALFYLIAAMILVFFVLTTGLLIYCVWRFSKKRGDKAVFSHGSHRLEMIWTAVPAVLLVVIAFSQMGTWASIKFDGATEGEEVFAEITACQFDWRFRYPGPDGKFGTVDDIESPYELVVPMESDAEGNPRKLLFNMRSRDVLHSFFVPKLRLKQDAVPGMVIPIWFALDPEDMAAEADNSFDIICAELCGWGHYKMSGRMRVVSPEEFDAWMEEKVAERFSNGTDEGSQG